MRIYLLYNKKGEIIESADAGYGFKFTPEEIKFNHPDKEILEITEEEYNKIKEKQHYFKIVNKKIKEKSKIEKEIIEKRFKEWCRNHTFEGLREQIEELRKIIVK